MVDRAKIVAHFSDGCFCNYERGGFPDGRAFLCEPRLNFKSEARKYAREHHMTIVAWNKYKSAAAILHEPCRHRQEQAVRLTWSLA